MAPLLSIVVPVFNEADSLEPLHQEIVDAVGPLGPFEVVLVDDGSTDESPRILERLAAGHDNVRVVRLRRNFGKAAALTHGFAEARGDRIITMDGDRQDDPAEIPKLLAKLDQGYDLASGWKQSRQDPLSKRLPSRFFNWTVRRSTGVSLHDFNCGLKAYRREVIDHVRIYGELHRYIPVLASDLGFRVTEEKVSHRRRTAGRSKYGWRRYARGYLDLLTVLFLGRYRQRPQHLFGGIGTMMVIVGVLIDLYLTIDKLLGHPIGQRPLLLLGTLLIIVGIQLVSLGLVGELITQARAREGRDDYEVKRVFDGAAARAALAARDTARAAALPGSQQATAVAPLVREAEAEASAAPPVRREEPL
jgi:glycosyltransferase involved in cell wall biosynthesis